MQSKDSIKFVTSSIFFFFNGLSYVKLCSVVESILNYLIAKNQCTLNFLARNITCVTNGPIWFFNFIIFPNPFSITLGNDNNLNVCPVGAVSNTTHEKFIPFTNLENKIIM